MRRRVIVLTSGGLDSTLALKIMEREGLDVIGVHFLSWFNIPKYRMIKDFPDEYVDRGFRILNFDISKEYTDILLHPRYGYGSGANPCIDCKILFFKKTKKLMEELKADFVASGEVLGQRPMSQMKNIMRLIEKKSGLKRYLLRPLSAKLLDPTVPEELGWVNRDRLYGISGRGRKKQRELVSIFGIEEYRSPAGGCLLTEKSFKARFQDLVKHREDIDVNDLIVLRYGRHFRICNRCKLVVGRDKRGNEFLKRLNWGNVVVDVINIPGPFSLMEWDGNALHLRLALKIIARYSDYEALKDEVRFNILYRDNERIVTYRGLLNQHHIDEMIIR